MKSFQSCCREAWNRRKDSMTRLSPSNNNYLTIHLFDQLTKEVFISINRRTYYADI